MNNNVYGIVLGNEGKIYYFNGKDLELNRDNKVVVETEKGVQLGTVSYKLENKKINISIDDMKPILRLATDEDISKFEENLKLSTECLENARNIAEELELDMNILDANYTLDRKQLLFNFIADERVDFRELAKNLASKYKTRIELRQIGVRDKAKEIGGLGPCGRPLCCSEFLSNFDSVSINMAKNQGLALNPSKINGSCGRLLCCLAYEDEVYSIYKKGMPKLNQKIKIKDIEGKVCELNILKRTYKIKTEDNMIIEMDCANESN